MKCLNHPYMLHLSLGTILKGKWSSSSKSNTYPTKILFVFNEWQIHCCPCPSNWNVWGYKRGALGYRGMFDNWFSTLGLEQRAKCTVLMLPEQQGFPYSLKAQLPPLPVNRQDLPLRKPEGYQGAFFIFLLLKLCISWAMQPIQPESLNIWQLLNDLGM